ncbi:MAG: T9SS type A sorting domain-containing protein, partial [Flammeovirgaceae bacterium]
NSNQSMAASWDVTPDDPTVSRNVRFRWLDSFDNITNPTKKFQVYRFSSGPGWTEVGTLQNLTATSPLRETAIVSVNSIDDTFTVTDESQVLPVELVSFSASSSNGVVQLSWTTASELNNESFTIERSRAGEKFEEVTKVKGMGTKLTPTNYSAHDSKPYKGTSYYRLKQTDFDGKTTYSFVVTVFVEGTDTWTIYPNPSGGSQFTISVGPENIDKPILIQMSNSAGQNLFSAQSVVDVQGELVIKSTESLSPGLYIATVTVGNQQKKHKIIIK